VGRVQVHVRPTVRVLVVLEAAPLEALSEGIVLYAQSPSGFLYRHPGLHNLNLDLSLDLSLDLGRI
jgi:hypothetical protein